MIFKIDKIDKPLANCQGGKREKEQMKKEREMTKKNNHGIGEKSEQITRHYAFADFCKSMFKKPRWYR